MYNNKALVIGANYYIGLSAIRCLGSQGVPVAAVDYSRERAYAFKSRWCREQLLAPNYRRQPQAFIDFLLEYGKRQSSKPVLFPTADAYAEILDQNYYALREYFLLPNPRQGFYTELLDKNRLHRLGIHHDMAVPESLSVRDIDRVEREIGYPCLLKPVTSPDFVRIFRVKVLVAQTRAQLEEAIALAQKHGLETIIQRIIPGFDDHMHTYDAYVDGKGNVTHWTTCQKKRQYPINFGASVFTQQKHVPELHRLGSEFFRRIGYRGFGEIEFKYDADRNKYYMIEVNVRLSNLNALLHRAGLNFPYIMYRDLIGDSLAPEAITWDTGLHFWSALEDAFALRDYLRQGQLAPGQVARSLLSKKVPSIWDWRDPLPGLSYGGQLLGKVGRKIFRR
jgi:D-aspartate ligase